MICRLVTCIQHLSSSFHLKFTKTEWFYETATFNFLPNTLKIKHHYITQQLRFYTNLTCHIINLIITTSKNDIGSLFIRISLQYIKTSKDETLI